MAGTPGKCVFGVTGQRLTRAGGSRNLAPVVPGAHPTPSRTPNPTCDNPALNRKNKMSPIKMDGDVSENKSFLKCQEGCWCSFLLFNAIKMIFFKLRNPLSVTVSSPKKPLSAYCLNT